MFESSDSFEIGESCVLEFSAPPGSLPRESGGGLCLRGVVNGASSPDEGTSNTSRSLEGFLGSIDGNFGKALTFFKEAGARIAGVVAREGTLVRPVRLISSECPPSLSSLGTTRGDFARRVVGMIGSSEEAGSMAPPLRENWTLGVGLRSGAGLCTACGVFPRRL